MREIVIIRVDFSIPFLLFFTLLRTNTDRTIRPIFMVNGSKDVVSPRSASFLGCEQFISISFHYFRQKRELFRNDNSGFILSERYKRMNF